MPAERADDEPNEWVDVFECFVSAGELEAHSRSTLLQPDWVGFMPYRRFHSSDKAAQLARHQLEQIESRIGGVEYRELDDGNWCVRTIPQSIHEPPLAAISRTLRSASDRLLGFLKLHS